MTNNDEQINDLELTAAAREAARTLLAEHTEWEHKPLRLYLCGKSCDGFEYGVSFDEYSKDDFKFSFDDLVVVADPETMLFCSGSQIDWVDDGRGRGFLVNNPRHKQYRGKFYKRRHWQERLEQKRASRNASTPQTD